MKFKNLQLIIDELHPTKADIIKVNEIGQTYFEKGVNLYRVNTSFIEGRFFWLYSEYDNRDRYNETVYNTQKEEEEINPKNREQIELRSRFLLAMILKRSFLFE